VTKLENWEGMIALCSNILMGYARNLLKLKLFVFFLNLLLALPLVAQTAVIL